MEVLTPQDVNVDALAEEVFWEAIRLAGGLKRLVEFKHLTWLPSLAAASYAVVMKEEALMTDLEIAERLGVSRETVRNMLRADPEEVKAYLEGRVEKVDEHKAGGLARMAYEYLKRRGELQERVSMTREELELLNVFWAGIVLLKLKGLDFPASKDQIKERLGGLSIEVDGVPVGRLLDRLPDELETPAELLKHLKQAAEEEKREG